MSDDALDAARYDASASYLPSWALKKTGLTEWWQRNGRRYDRISTFPEAWKVSAYTPPDLRPDLRPGFISGQGPTLDAALQDCYLQWCKKRFQT